jgi:CheY-like chemotaxis protein
MKCICYRDVFGAWRWEAHDGKGFIQDSTQSYDTRDDCVRAAEQAGYRLQETAKSRPTGPGLGTGRQRSILCVLPLPELQQSVLDAAVTRYAITLVVTSQDAVQAFRTQSFDGYILDYWLPDGAGVDLCRMVRDSEPNTPICLYTTYGHEEYRKRALSAGADAFLCSPQNSDTVRRELARLFRSSDVASFHARVEEQHVIQEELVRRAAEAVALSDQAKRVGAASRERIAHAKAFEAFLEAGGTRANFERWWPELIGGPPEEPQ